MSTIFSSNNSIIIVIMPVIYSFDLYAIALAVLSLPLKINYKVIFRIFSILVLHEVFLKDNANICAILYIYIT